MTVVARNFMPPGGKAEADLIAWDGDELAIVEVKTRSNIEFGPPERNVNDENDVCPRNGPASCRRMALHPSRCTGAPVPA